MSEEQLKATLLKELESATPEVLKEVLEYLKAMNDQETSTKAIRLRKILSEDRRLLERLAQ